jgi:hypothetical protein
VAGPDISARQHSLPAARLPMPAPASAAVAQEATSSRVSPASLALRASLGSVPLERCQRPEPRPPPVVAPAH